MRRLPAALAALVLFAFASRPNAATPTCEAAYACPKGQTCATKDGRVFACTPAGAGKVGDPCDATSGTPVTCGEGLSCLATGVPKKGSCVAWCGGPKSCSPGTTRGAVTTTKGASLKLCVPCNVVYACGAGQTCATVTGTAFSCMASGRGRAGDTCDARVNAPIVCGDRLVCIASGNPKAGTCVSWCDKAHPCAAGRVCQVVTTTKGAALPVCLSL